MKKLVIVLFSVLLAGCSAYVGQWSNVGSMMSISLPPNEDAIKAYKTAGAPVALSAVFGERNSANGISVGITWKNITEDTLKYCWFEVEFINSVDDVVYSEISRKASVVLKDTGPFERNKVEYGNQLAWERVFYHPNANRIRVKQTWCSTMDDKQTDKTDISAIPQSIGRVGS